jgi:16S rRNA (cytidine1402-2'-O)-methyltransferase
MIPTTIGDVQDNPKNQIAPSNLNITIGLTNFIVENLKTTRRFLRKLDPEFDIDNSTFHVLNKHTKLNEINAFLQPCREGKNIGMISEAGCPGIADPGANIVAIAHKENIKVVPLIGPSSIFMALMASGLNGQNFCFNGYLPIDKALRIKKIKQLSSSCNNGISQIFMETPFRNDSLLGDILLHCNEDIKLCIASNISTYNELIKTYTIKKWKEKKLSLNKKPSIFILGKD